MITTPKSQPWEDGPEAQEPVTPAEKQKSRILEEGKMLAQGASYPDSSPTTLIATSHQIEQARLEMRADFLNQSFGKPSVPLTAASAREFDSLQASNPQLAAEFKKLLEGITVPYVIAKQVIEDEDYQSSSRYFLEYFCCLRDYISIEGLRQLYTYYRTIDVDFFDLNLCKNLELNLRFTLNVINEALKKIARKEGLDAEQRWVSFYRHGAPAMTIWGLGIVL